MYIGDEVRLTFPPHAHFQPIPRMASIASNTFRRARALCSKFVSVKSKEGKTCAGVTNQVVENDSTR